MKRKSKAEEYAEAIKQPESVDTPDPPTLHTSNMFAQVAGIRGVPFLYIADDYVPVKEALRLADWIYDTFGEPKE